MTRTTIIKSDMSTAKILYPEEAQQQTECIMLLKQQVDVFVEANMPDRNVLQSYGTALSSLVTLATILAMHLEMSQEDITKLFTMAVEGNYKNAKH